MRKSPLLEKRRKWVLDTVAHWKQELNLQGWKFLIKMDAKVEEGVALEIGIQSDYERATIFISTLFWNNETCAPQFREQMVVHELCHCLTEECYDLLLAQINDKHVTHREVNLARERLTERIAQIVCPVGDE